MSSTNKTTNYDLSQFVGSDKPAWLSDYNQDMSKIDTAIKSASDAATSAGGEATSAATSIGDLTTLTTDVKTSVVAAINEVDNHADTAQNTANAANTLATQTKNEIDAITDYLSLSTATSSSVSTNLGTIASGSSLSIRRNSTNSLGKIYGSFTVNNVPTSGTMTITIADTGLRPGSPITFNGCAYVRIESRDSHIYRDLMQTYTLNTDGTITITRDLATLNGSALYFSFIACLLFITDFGDLPEE